jgi:hypothetical protein
MKRRERIGGWASRPPLVAGQDALPPFSSLELFYLEFGIWWLKFDGVGEE